MPNSPQTLQQAAQLHAKGQLAEAEAIYRRLLAQHPERPDLLHLTGVISFQQGRWEEALDLLWRAIDIDPNIPDFHNNRGIILDHAGRREQAIESFRQAIKLKENYAEAHNNLAGTLASIGQIDDAINEYQIAITQKPDYTDAWDNLGSTLRMAGRDHDALAAYDQAISLRPDFAYAHFNRGTLLLSQGRFDLGWEDFEWRWRCPTFGHPLRNLGKPMWDGSDLSDKTLLMHAEQGLGDTLNFVRYAALLADRGARVIVEAQPEMVTLLSEVPGVSQVIERQAPLPDFDFHIPMMSVPRIVKTTLETIPHDVPYVLAPAVAHEIWRRTTGDDARADGEKKLRVGLAWAGNPRSLADQKRSISLDMLAPLAAAPNVRFYSLQRGIAAEQVATSPFPIIDYTKRFIDFVQTAGLIANLDLVICVDTVIAHLAGAMNHPVWLLTYTPPDWRWMLDRDTSPWYPSMKLFRQKSRGDWSDPIQRVADALRALGERLQ